MSAAASIGAPAGGRQAFLDAMAQAALSVSVVATDGPAGRDGVVVTAMAPVSADAEPPSLLICLHRSGRAVEKLLANGVFSVNLLADSQLALAERFAGRSGLAREAWFADLQLDILETGAPLLVDALAGFDCEVTEASLHATHHVIFGAVRAVRLGPSGQPLVHAQRRYRRLAIQQE